MKKKKDNHDDSQLFLQVGFQMRVLREKKGLKIKELCDILKKKYNHNINANLLGKIERGTSKIQLDTFLHLCRYFNVDYTYFVEKNKSNPAAPELMNKIVQSELNKEIIKIIGLNQKEEWKNQITYDFLKIFIPKIELLIQKNTKSQVTLLKAASSEKDNRQS